jgi:uncharacterized protein (DUF1015 family)
LPERLQEFFDVQKIDISGNGWKKMKDQMKEDSSRFFIYGLNGNEVLSLKAKTPAKIENLMPSGHTAAYRGMDVSVVDHIVLENILGMNAMDEERIAYDHDLDSTVARVKSGEFQFVRFRGNGDWRGSACYSQWKSRGNDCRRSGITHLSAYLRGFR